MIIILVQARRKDLYANKLKNNKKPNNTPPQEPLPKQNPKQNPTSQSKQLFCVCVSEGRTKSTYSDNIK